MTSQRVTVFLEAFSVSEFNLDFIVVSTLVDNKSTLGSPVISTISLQIAMFGQSQTVRLMKQRYI